MKYAINRTFDDGSSLDFTVVDVRELNEEIGSFVAIYSLLSKIEIERNKMTATNENGGVRTFKWKLIRD